MPTDDDDTYKSGELVEHTEGRSLPTIPLPPVGVIKTALFTAFKYGSVARAYQAYEHALAAAADTNAAIAELHYSKIERERSIATLRNAGKIHEADHLERERLYEDAEADAKIAEMRRTRMLTDEEDQHARWKAKREGRGSDADFDPDNLSPKLKEFAADLLHEADAEDMNLDPASDAEQMRALTEEFIKRDTHAKGGDNRLTPVDRDTHRRLRETTERFITEGKF